MSEQQKGRDSREAEIRAEAAKEVFDYIELVAQTIGHLKGANLTLQIVKEVREWFRKKEEA